MLNKRIWYFTTLLVIFVLLAACAGKPTQQPAATVAPATQPPVTQAPATQPPATQAPTVNGPTELNIAVITCCSLDSQWDASLVQALDRVKAKMPHGLKITYVVTDNTFGDDAIPVIKNYADSGKYGIIWLNSSYSDQVAKVMDSYPNIMFIVGGSGNRGLGKNQYWAYMRVIDPAYLLGMIAGRMTKTNKIGAVGTFAADDVNDEINAFFQGAKDVNPKIKVTVSFIESWFDPVAGSEATTAQAAAGVDWMLQLADGWQGCISKNIMCIGNFGDQNSLAPNNVPNSTLSLWDPDINWVIDQWWLHAAGNQPWNGNTTPVWFTMAQGGSDLGPWHGFDSKIPKDVMDQMNQKRQDILDGKFVVPLDITTPKSDTGG